MFTVLPAAAPATETSLVSQQIQQAQRLHRHPSFTIVILTIVLSPPQSLAGIHPLASACCFWQSR